MDIVNGQRVLQAATATRQAVFGRLKAYQYGLGIGMSKRFNLESFPEQSKKISIHSDGGRLVNFVVLANSKLTGFTAVSYFFTLLCEEPFFWAEIGELAFQSRYGF